MIDSSIIKRLLKVIVVEDDPTLCRLFAETLDDDAGITTAQAHDLPDAVQLCRQERQVVLLVDLGLPNAKGVEAVKALRRETPGATLVVITGFDDMVEPAKKAGAHAVILKASDDSKGQGLIDAVRKAVVAHDVELMFSPAVAAMERAEKKLDLASDSVTREMLKQKPPKSNPSPAPKA